TLAATKNAGPPRVPVPFDDGLDRAFHNSEKGVGLGRIHKQRFTSFYMPHGSSVIHCSDFTLRPALHHRRSGHRLRFGGRRGWLCRRRHCWLYYWYGSSAFEKSHKTPSDLFIGSSTADL